MPVVLITGGTTGIGFEMARSFCKRGHTVLISGTSAERLLNAKTRLAQEFEYPVGTFVQDLSIPGGAKALVQQLNEAGHQVDVLVNNAGMGLMGATEEINMQEDEKMLRLNMVAVVDLCKLLLPAMYQRGRGKILNVASVAAYQPGPYNSTYFASKSFVLSYSRAIRYEAKKHGVQVCTLCPGSTNTPFFEKEGLETPPLVTSPEVVAEYAIHGLMRDKAIIVPGLMNKVSRILPSAWKIALVAKMKDLGKPQ